MAKAQMQKALIAALEKAGVAKEHAKNIETPPKREMGDFAFPCFAMAKELKKSPIEIAKELCAKIKLPKGFTHAQAKGPYLNFFVDDSAYAQEIMAAAIEKEKKKPAKGKPIIVEYCQANPLKSFHIGHVRNICLGESIARLFETRGKKVIRANYEGDVGPHVSKTIFAYQKLWKGKEPTDIKEIGQWLGELYALGAQAVKGDEELEQKMRDMVVALERKDKKLVADWKKLRKQSLEYFDSIYMELGIKFDRIILESEVEKDGIEIAKKLHAQGFAKKDEGALLVDLTEYGLEKFLVLKSDGAALYSSKDIALAKMKKKEMGAQKSYNVVGSEQKFYFQQLIKTLELLNAKKPEYCETEHVPYELVKAEGGKMSSREGNVITYAELYDRVYEKTLAETAQRHADWDAKRIIKAANAIALTAIKFGMLAQDKNKSIIFNWDRATSLEGETGPFVQYSHARALSILEKAGVPKKPKKIVLGHAKEKELLAVLGSFEDVEIEAANNLSPHKICHYCLELASAFNSFYQECQVLNAQPEIRETRLALVNACAKTLEKALKLLNIDAMAEM
ncbi:MAG: arginine--tRNA ligase [archaeon]|nr:arginine--tRNA ligase [archaeon]